MFTRRQFFERSLQASSLVALSSTVPGFLARTARAAESGQDRILVVVELTGGNDGLNTVIPYADDLYHKARPTLRIDSQSVIRVDDVIGLNPALRGLDTLLNDGQLAVLQGIGYPNPNRSHFESMDVWQSADPRGRTKNGWLARTISDMQISGGGIPALHIGPAQLPLALSGSGTGVPSLNSEKPFGLDLLGEFYGHQPDGTSAEASQDVETESIETSDDEPAPDGKHRGRKAAQQDRKQLIRELAELSREDAGMLSFVRRTSLETYQALDVLQEVMGGNFQVPDAQYDFSGGRYEQTRSGIVYELMLVAAMIQAGFGTRIFYVALDGFDTHGDQRQSHDQLLQKLGTAIGGFFAQLKPSGDDQRVLLTTYSEFGRRVHENGSKGTDHGSGACLFVAGPAVQGGAIGPHPSLAEDDLDNGDLQFHTDFRRVYATLIDQWLAADSQAILGNRFEPVSFLKSP